jgi:uncharacterized protein YukE
LKELEKDRENLIKNVERGIGKEFGEEFEKKLKDLEQNIGKMTNDLEGGLRKEFGEKVKELDKNIDELDKNIDQGQDSDENEFSLEAKSFLSKAKKVVKTLKEYERLVGEDTKNSDDFQIATDFGSNSNFSSPGQQRLSRNIAHQNVRRASQQPSSPKLHAVGHGSMGVGPTTSGQTRKTGTYDPSRKEVSGGGMSKAFDPFKKLYHKTEKLRDGLDHVNNQLKQVNDPADIFIELLRKAAKSDDIGVSNQENIQNNNVDNNGNSLMDNIISSKSGSNNKKDSEASSEESSLGHRNHSQTSKIEHHPNSQTSKVEHHSEKQKEKIKEELKEKIKEELKEKIKEELKEKIKEELKKA